MWGWYSPVTQQCNRWQNAYYLFPFHISIGVKSRYFIILTVRQHLLRTQSAELQPSWQVLGRAAFINFNNPEMSSCHFLLQHTDFIAEI